MFSDKMPKEQQRLHPVSVEEYNLLIQLQQGSFRKPVQNRSSEEKRTIVHYYRIIDHLAVKSRNGKDVLFFRGEEVLTKQGCLKEIKRKLHGNLGSGARSVRHTLKGNYTCFGERKILGFIKKDKILSKTNACFTNKPPLKTIQAKHVFEKVQIDLISMRKEPVEYNGKQYKYILSLIDVLSRFTICKPLPKKTAHHVRQAVEEIIFEHGCTETIQTDNGTEFKGEFKELMKKHKIKVVHGRPYHPESQGKVERNNALIKKKLRYLVNTKQGTNWVKELPKVCFVLNSTPKEAIGFLTPINVYFGRTKKSVDRMRDKALYRSLKSTKRSNFKKGRACSLYRIGEKILLKYPFTKSRVPLKRSIIKGTIEKRHESLVKYVVRYVAPSSRTEQLSLVPVECITSVTREKEESRPKLTAKNFETKLQQQRHRSRYYIVLDDKESATPPDDENSSGSSPHIQSNTAESDGFPYYVNVVFNPSKYGSCQFDALSDQLMKTGVYRTGEQLREVAVKHLLEHETFYANFFDSKKSFYTYISKIRRQSTYGDHFTLQALAREFNVQILVVSVTGPQYNTLISNTGIYAEEIPTLTLGYYHEERGEHYCSVEVAHAHLIRFLETFRTQTEKSDDPNIQTSSTENIPASYQYEVDSHESPGTSFAADKCHTTAPDERDIITPSPAEGNENIHIDADFPSHVNVLLNPVKYGNCQFDAFAHQLTKIEINRTSEQLRQIAVKHLFKHRHFFGHFFSIDDVISRLPQENEK